MAKFEHMRLTGKCPCCRTNFFFADNVGFETVRNATTDCRKCGVLLKIDTKLRVWEFEKYMEDLEGVKSSWRTVTLGLEGDDDDFETIAE